MALKKLCILLSALLLLPSCAPVRLRAEGPSVPARSGSVSGPSLHMSEEEIQQTLTDITAEVPKTETTEITLTPLPEDEIPAENNGEQDGNAEDVTLYSAEVHLSWDTRLGRFSVEKALDGYSRTLAVNMLSGAPPVLLLDISWTIPYHAEDESAMVYSFVRNGDVIWQTGLYDRFTDGSFGADAFLETPMNPVPASIKIDAAPIATLTADPVSPFWSLLPPTAEQAIIVTAPRTEIS